MTRKVASTNLEFTELTVMEMFINVFMEMIFYGYKLVEDDLMPLDVFSSQKGISCFLCRLQQCEEKCLSTMNEKVVTYFKMLSNLIL